MSTATCACGCGATTRPGARWVKGHQNRTPTSGDNEQRAYDLADAGYSIRRIAALMGRSHAWVAETVVRMEERLGPTKRRRTGPAPKPEPWESRLAKLDGMGAWHEVYRGPVRSAHNLAYKLRAGKLGLNQGGEWRFRSESVGTPKNGQGTVYALRVPGGLGHQCTNCGAFYVATLPSCPLCGYDKEAA